ncbi:MAG: FG-GAP-like repeat-containing protein [Bacteroidota bacterium]|nr:FG-GAP-like repeat-containing protein [Bacteroidota bacterium]
MKSILVLNYFILIILPFLGRDILSQEQKTVPVIADRKTPTWIQFESPTKANLRSIKMFSPNNGIITGKYLLKYDGNEWKAIHKQFGQSSELDFYVLDENNIWAANTTLTFLTELFHYGVNGWKKVEHPFANAISSMHFISQNSYWIAGDREIAFYDGLKWKFIPIPQNLYPNNYIFGDSQDRVWVNFMNEALFFYNGVKWEKFLNEPIKFVNFENISHGYVLTNNKLYEITNNHLSIHSSNELFKEIKSLFFLKTGGIIGVGKNGLVLKYKNQKWERVSVPTKETLNDIHMISEKEGWIVGENGTILKLSDSSENSKLRRSVGFDQIDLQTWGRESNDVYGVAIDDINNDGLKDIYNVCIFEQNRLYIQQFKESATGEFSINQFVEESIERNATGFTGEKSIASVAELYLGVGLSDVDNDGDLDLYLCDLSGKNKLLLNNGNGYFQNVSEQTGRPIGENERTNSAVFGDVDNDGDLDLFITNEYSTNRLFLNKGNGFFEDVTERSGLKSEGGGMCAAFGDIDGDGDLDLYVTNWAAKNVMYRNENNKLSGIKFTDITDSAGVGGEFYTKSNAVCFADFDNDGDLDLFVTNRKTSNRLYLNKRNNEFEDITKNAIGLDSMLSYGASFADFDQDGFLDLYVANVGDDIIYKNINGTKFIDITLLWDATIGGYSTGTAVGDIDNDGDVDLFVGNYLGANSSLFLNRLDTENFVTITIEGTKSNRDAVGVKAWIYKSGYSESKEHLLGYREINSGTGYSSHSSKELHFGLGENKFCDIVIYFPASGIKKVIKNIKKGSRLNVSEEEWLKAILSLSSKSIKRFVTSPITHFEAVKFIFLLSLISLSINLGTKRYKWKIKQQVFFHLSIVIIYWVQIYIFIYDDLFFSTILPLLLSIAVLFIIHLIYERVVLVRRVQIEKRIIRDKIARDFHDDLASTISSTVMYTNILKRSAKNLSQTNYNILDKVNKLLIESSSAITDIVWAVSSKLDKLEDLIARLRLLIDDSCKTAGIVPTFQIEDKFKDLNIKDDFRRNVYLIFKEALSNSINHSGAQNLFFEVILENRFLEISLADDGKGFEAEVLRKDLSNSKVQTGSLRGNGLKNMKSRAEEINASLKIESKPNEGTKITINKKM